MAKYHDKQNLMSAGTELAGYAMRKDFTSKEAADCAFEVAGCLNDFRSDETPGPIKFGAAPGAKPVAVPKTPGDAAKLAEKLQKETGPQKFGAPADGQPAELSPVAISIISALLQFFLGRLVK